VCEEKKSKKNGELFLYSVNKEKKQESGAHQGKPSEKSPEFEN